MGNIFAVAGDNWMALNRNPYPGRGIVMGMDCTGEYVVQIYWIMGRSANSRNRVFSVEGGRVFTEPADPAKVNDPSLIIYTAMERVGFRYAVSNGSQTDKVADRGIDALRKYHYEPDAPNFTPRITGVVEWLDGNIPVLRFAILRKSKFGDGCDTLSYDYPCVGNGFGYCVTTYMGDGDPLPSFEGEPIPLPIVGNIGRVARNYWGILNAANRVSLAVKFIPLDGGQTEVRIINKYKKIA